MTTAVYCWQYGPNRLPLYGLVAIAAVSLLFIFIGDINTLGPVVTIPFLLTYAAVDYAYFVLAMSFDQRKRHTTNYLHDGIAADAGYGTVGHDDVYDGGLFGASRKSPGMYDEGKVSETAKMVDGDMDASAFPVKSGYSLYAILRGFRGSYPSQPVPTHFVPVHTLSPHWTSPSLSCLLKVCLHPTHSYTSSYKDSPFTARRIYA